MPRFWIAVAITVFWQAADSASAEQPASRTAADKLSETTDLPEVQVVGKRLYQMKRDIIKMEEKFLARYNELNTDDDFDVRCQLGESTGSRIKKRICTVQFYERAQTDYAIAVLNGDYAPAPELVALQRGPEYERKALAIINANPELRRWIRERDELEKKYKIARKEAFKGHWFAF